MSTPIISQLLHRNNLLYIFKYFNVEIILKISGYKELQ